MEGASGSEGGTLASRRARCCCNITDNIAHLAARAAAEKHVWDCDGSRGIIEDEIHSGSMLYALQVTTAWPKRTPVETGAVPAPAAHAVANELAHNVSIVGTTIRPCATHIGAATTTKPISVAPGIAWPTAKLLWHPLAR